MPPKKKPSRPRPVYLETTVPVIRRCSCGVWLAAGVAEGLKAEIEFVALDRGQQVWAILNKIDLYCFRRSGLVYLDACRLAQPMGAVYPQHHCHIRWPVKTGAVRHAAKNEIPPY